MIFGNELEYSTKYSINTIKIYDLLDISATFQEIFRR